MQYLDIGDKLNLELKGDNLRANDTLWDETILNRPKELDAQLLESLKSIQFAKCMDVVSLHSGSRFKKEWPKATTI